VGQWVDDKAVMRLIWGYLNRTVCAGGVKTNRDAWAYNFNKKMLAENMQRMIDCYNNQVKDWLNREIQNARIDDFVWYDDSLMYRYIYERARRGKMRIREATRLLIWLAL